MKDTLNLNTLTACKILCLESVACAGGGRRGCAPPFGRYAPPLFGRFMDLGILRGLSLTSEGLLLFLILLV